MKPLKPSTRQQLEKVAPYLYRHSIRGTYHAIKRVSYKLKTRKLDTADRKIATARLRDWITEMSAVDPGNSDLTLAALVE